MKIKILEALEALKEAYNNEYCNVEVRAHYNDIQDETRISWKVYVNGLTWSDECESFEGAMQNLKKWEEKHLKKSRFVED